MHTHTRVCEGVLVWGSASDHLTCDTFVACYLVVPSRFFIFLRQGLCELAVQKGITVDNAAPLLHTSDDLRASRLRDICMRFVVRHFDTVSKSEVGSISARRGLYIFVVGCFFFLFARKTCFVVSC